MLENLGWKIHRIWSTDWWLNPEREVEKIGFLLERLVEESASDEAVSLEAQTSVAVEESFDGSAPEALSFPTPDPAAVERETLFASAVTPSAVAPKTAMGTGATVYALAQLESGTPVAFYEAQSSDRLTSHLQQVIELEGPLPERIAYQRVARAWGLERTGARIVERLRELMPSAVVQTVEADDVFLWPADADRSSLFGFRVADESDASRRRTADVCKEELSAMVFHVLSGSSEGLPRSEIARSVSRLIGQARTTAEAEKRIMLCVDALLGSGAASESEEGLISRRS
ncbi:DUF3320 domain-containing protein [Xenophilus aerolatus]|nr:DUF3320 domain-containing protein [Xenophilus aerolatus]